MNLQPFEEKIKEAETIITNLIRERKIITSLTEKERGKFVVFYRKQANLSLLAADLLFTISTQSKAKEFHKLKADYECFLWVINSSYYSMFYVAHSLLAYKGVRISQEQGIHKKTAYALLYFGVKNNFIAKKLYKQFIEGQQEATGLFNLEEFQVKAKDLASNYFYELDKRSKFTYEIDEEAKERHALTSLRRAKEFMAEIEKIMM